MQTTLCDTLNLNRSTDTIRRTDIHPVIISASRATDIPAWYMDWFMDRLQKGYIIWVNPYRPTHHQIVRFDATRIIVFWTKNPAPLIPYISELEENGYYFYVHVTLNDYEREGIEPNLPSYRDRIRSCIELSHQIGRDRVIWRYDPIIMIDSLSVQELINRIENIGDQIALHVNRMIFSFVQIARYKNVRSSLMRHMDTDIREPTVIEREVILQALFALSQKWNIPIEACGEASDYSSYGIKKAQCINPNLLVQICADDTDLCGYIMKNKKKDPGQRATCTCIRAKDIGQYSTCMHLCHYCYANRDEKLVYRRYREHLEAFKKGIDLPSIVFDSH